MNLQSSEEENSVRSSRKHGHSPVSVCQTVRELSFPQNFICKHNPFFDDIVFVYLHKKLNHTYNEITVLLR